MNNLNQLKEQHHSEFSLSPVGRDLLMHAPETDDLERFISDLGYGDFHFVGYGNKSIVIGPADNQDIVLRIARKAPSGGERAVIPHILQPLYTFYTPGKRLQLEIMPKVRSSSESENLDVALADYHREVTRSGYSFHDKLQPYDTGIFHYHDPAQPDQIKQILIGIDPGLIHVAKTDKNKEPTCSTSYPSLQIQHAEQVRVVGRDARLSALIGTPASLPDTHLLP